MQNTSKPPQMPGNKGLRLMAEKTARKTKEESKPPDKQKTDQSKDKEPNK